jgi:hypothetical protein
MISELIKTWRKKNSYIYPVAKPPLSFDPPTLTTDVFIDIRENMPTEFK